MNGESIALIGGADLSNTGNFNIILNKIAQYVFALKR